MTLSPIAEEKYSPAEEHLLKESRNSLEDIDFQDNDSDITQIASREPSPQRKWTRSRAVSDLSVLSEDYMELPSRKSLSRRRKLVVWLPWTVSFSLQTIIVLLLLSQHSYKSPQLHLKETQTELIGKHVETGGDINGLYKDLSHTYKHLKPNPSQFIPNLTSNIDRFEIRKNWDHLMPLGSGSLAIPSYASHPLLGNPIIDDPLRSGPLFEASWTHALHCLYYTLDSYHQLLLHYQDADYEVDEYHMGERHVGHCFEYLRNQVLCNLDMTLEGDMSLPEEKARGQGHVCRDYEAARRWVEERRVDDVQDIVGP